MRREVKPVLDVILKRFEQPDELRTFEKGKFELVRLGGMTIGRATYEPGWKWSVHVGAATGAKSCLVEHIGMVVSGCATAAMVPPVRGRICSVRFPPGEDRRGSRPVRTHTTSGA